jgi:hypothetical protein
MIGPIYKDVEERTKLLNKDSDKRSVLYSIDRPIRQLVIELNRIGLTTTFSCCGFTYENQEEPKSHEKAPYITFRIKKEPEIIDNFFRLSEISVSLGWAVGLNSNGLDWGVYSPNQEYWTKCDNLEEAVHQYELKIIAIKNLTDAVKVIPSFNETVIIRDGNELRREKYGPEWLVAPKQPAEINCSEIN